MATADTSEAIKRVEYEIFLNGTYHADREAALDRRHRLMMFFVVVCGTSAVSEIFGAASAPYFALVTTVIGAFDLAFGFSVRAKNHAYLRKEYFRVLADLKLSKSSISDAEVRMTELAAEEEPIFMAAHAIAANWAHRAVYGDVGAQPCRVSFFQRRLRHIFLMTSQSFKPK